MHRTERTAFAWSLVDVAKASLAHEVQVWLCVKIGAGEQEEAIHGLLHILADHAVAIPVKLLAPLRDWVSGYLGSDKEPNLRALLACLRVPDLLHSTSPAPAPAPAPAVRWAPSTNRPMPFNKRESMGRVGMSGYKAAMESCSAPFCNATCSTGSVVAPEPHYAWRS